MGKLDTAMVNGPEGDVLDWDAVEWRRVEGDVRRLRQRIFTATQAGDLKKVRNLQKLMLRSRANALLSVRRVTERNAGRKTAGVDGRLVLGAREKAELAAWLQHDAAAWSPKPVRRVVNPHSLPTPASQTAPAADQQHFCIPDLDGLQGLLEPGASNGARRVLRGRRRSNAPPLPDYWAADLLQACGATVHLAHPLGVKLFGYQRARDRRPRRGQPG